MSTIISLANDVAGEIGYTRGIASLFATYDEGDEVPFRIKRGLQRVTQFLATYYDWPVIRGEHTFTSQANGIQTGALPSSFRRIIKGTVYDRSNQCRVLGPVPAQEWQRRLSMSMLVGPPIFMIRGTDFLLRTNYATGATIAYEYIGKHVGTNASNTKIEAFSADSDQPLWDDELMRLGLIWTLLHRDGAQTNTDYEMFVQALHERIGETGSGDALDMSGMPDTIDPRIPETWPGVT